MDELKEVEIEVKEKNKTGHERGSTQKTGAC